jgi:hypothetical protein
MNTTMRLLDREIKIDGRLLRSARIGAENFLFLDDPKPILNAAKKCSTRIDIFTFQQRPPDTKPKYPYPMTWDNLAVLRVSTFDYWWNHQIRSLARNRARQAEKRGVVLREVPFSNDLVRGIWEIYNEVPVRQGRRFPHYGKDLDTVYREEATHPDNSIFLGAYLGEKLIGFARLVVDETKTHAGFMNILSFIEHRDKAPTNALIGMAVRVCAERRIPFLTYLKFTYGNKGRDSLSEFKENNGFSRVELPRYFVPLTPLGRVGIALGLHRELIDRVPAPIWNKFRELRAAWHTRSVSAHARLSQEGR